MIALSITIPAGERLDRIVAGAAAAGLVCWVMSWLMSIQSSQEQRPDGRSVPMRVVWIDRQQPPDADELVLPVPEPRVTAEVVRRETRMPQRPQGEALDAAPHVPELDGHRQIDLSLPTAPIEFRSNEVGTRYAREAPPQRMRIQFHDRSFGATLQRVTQSLICIELRQEASRAPQSSEQIAASMARHGCEY
ncbi:hypothetical protein [Luteimonas sp. 3794]|uniref:hypothetical protein n=1 Tax=Luteimonas sp. 3794 TaxID=2817730 RepID=UPI002862BED7|nr:hypothetical protein [Luteimonas sp. 3794]MDR6992724.1 hypothetical protein [Luteimonas sp. 3794]